MAFIAHACPPQLPGHILSIQSLPIAPSFFLGLIDHVEIEVIFLNVSAIFNSLIILKYLLQHLGITAALFRRCKRNFPHNQ